MARFDANEVSWEKVKVLDKEGLFSDLRIKRDSIPEGYLMYEIRHNDEDWGEPVEIALGVLVNFFGTLLVKESLELESSPTGNAYLCIGEGCWEYLDEIVKFSKDEDPSK